MVILCLICWGTTTHFATVFDTPTNSAQRLQFLHIFSNTWFFLFLVFILPSYQVRGGKSLWFWFALPYWWLMWCTFYVFIDHLYVSEEISIQVLCLFFNQVDFFGCLVVGVLYILWMLSSYQTQDLQIFSPISWISLSLTWLYPIMHRSFILM